MCFVDQPKAPKPAPAPRPAPQLTQVAPESTDETGKKERSRRSGTKRYRAGSTLTIPSATSTNSGGLSIPGG